MKCENMIVAILGFDREIIYSAESLASGLPIKGGEVFTANSAVFEIFAIFIVILVRN